MKLIPKAVSMRFGRQLLHAQKASPQIMFAAGVVGVVGTAVLTARATLKLSNVLENGSSERDRANELYKDGAYTGEDGDRKYAKDLTVIKLRTAVDVTKLYALPVAVGSISIALLTGSHVTINRRNASLAAAYAGVDNAFREYRSRVRDELGDDQDRNFRYGVERSEETVGTGDKKKVIIKETVANIKQTNNARFFDELCDEWKPSAEYNLVFLRARQGYLNDLLQARGHVFLNEVYDQLGLPRSGAGAVVGWVLGNGDNYIDFGIFNDAKNDRVRDFVNGREHSILLDFNVDEGTINDKI